MKKKFLAIMAATIFVSGCGNYAPSEPHGWEPPENEDLGNTKRFDGLDRKKQGLSLDKLNSMLSEHGAHLVYEDDQIVLWLPERITFSFDQSDLNHDADTLEALALFMGEADARLRVEGHTDAPGTDEYNDRLGFDRAVKTMESLVTKGVEPQRVFVASLADQEKRVATSDPERENRRVEFYLLTR